MDNKQAISWLKLAVPVRVLTREEFEKFIIAVNIAMNSIEAWDKVEKDLIEIDAKKYEQLDFMDGVNKAIAVIEKYKKEIEE